MKILIIIIGILIIKQPQISLAFEVPVFENGTIINSDTKSKLSCSGAIECAFEYLMYPIIFTKDLSNWLFESNESKPQASKYEVRYKQTIFGESTRIYTNPGSGNIFDGTNIFSDHSKQIKIDNNSMPYGLKGNTTSYSGINTKIIPNNKSMNNFNISLSRPQKRQKQNIFKKSPTTKLFNFQKHIQVVGF